jgi:hypothetical protein
VCGRPVRKDVRTKEERFDPGRCERCGCSEANIKLRGTDEWRLTRMLIATRRDQRNRANVVSAVRVIVNVSVQSRRDADEKCPGKRGKQKGRNENTHAGL